jgi:hypothetical protein
MEKHSNQDDMSTLLSCMKKAKTDGYTISFNVTEEGVSHADNDTHFYSPDQITIDNFYRFEGASDPDDNSILYLIQTADGEKGILVNAYGLYADPLVAAFIEQVEEISKTTSKA